MKKILSVLLTLVLLLGATNALAVQDAPAYAPITEPVTITMWHSATSAALTSLEKLVADFNALDNNITVVLEFQGIYEDAVTKLRGLEPGTGPDIMQMWEAATSWMSTYKNTVKMQSFIDRDNYDVSDFEPNITAYYSINNELYSMPFQCSVACLMYNKTALDALGLDYKEAFYSMDRCYDTAIKMKEYGIPYGATVPNASWYFEEFMARQGAPIVDNGNGHEGQATATVMRDSDAAREALAVWKKMYDTGVSFNFGQGGLEDGYQFIAGNVGFTFYSTAGINAITSMVGDAFEVGFAPYPRVHDDDVGGVAVGGNSLWIFNNGDDMKANAAWEFIKYLAQTEQQAFASISTGYLPASISAKNTPEFIEYATNVNPFMYEMIETFETSEPSSIGALYGVFSQARLIAQNVIEELINNEIDLDEAVESLCQQIDDEIYMYNRTNK